MAEEQEGIKMETKADVMELFGARQKDFKPVVHTLEEEKELKHMRGGYAGEIMLAKRYSGTSKTGMDYDFITISIKVTGNGPKTKVNGKGRWVKKDYSLKDKTNREGEVYTTAAEEIDRLLNDFHAIGMPTTFKTTGELEGLLAEMSADKDMDDKYVDGTGHKVFMDIKPRYNFISEGKFELKFDDKGFPMQKFEFLADLPGYVEEGEKVDTGGM